MAIRQMLLTVTVEKTALNGEGRPYNYYQDIQIDLVHGDVGEFLTRIADDINEHSCVMLVIQREDGEMVSFVDGMMPESQGNGWSAMKRVCKIGDGEYADELRRTARLLAERRSKRLQETE